MSETPNCYTPQKCRDLELEVMRLRGLDAAHNDEYRLLREELKDARLAAYRKVREMVGAKRVPAICLGSMTEVLEAIDALISAEEGKR